MHGRGRGHGLGRVFWFFMEMGITTTENGTNFAVFAPYAKTVTLLIFHHNQLQKFPLQHTDNIWHTILKDLPSDCLYLYEIDDKQAIDPYAKGVFTTNHWNDRTQKYIPYGIVDAVPAFDWSNDRPPNIPLQNLILYEMHVRGFTQDTSSKTIHPGTFLGVIEKIPHLKQLGINAVELLPLFEFNEKEIKHLNPITDEPFVNYWGYSTVNFFSCMQRYASTNNLHAPFNEFRQMVKALHENGIEVILDVVYNHTSEGNQLGPTHSFKALANDVYYILDSHGGYTNYSGTGNSFNCNHPIVQELILKSLRFWVSEMHVDGFRFDLASQLTRSPTGIPLAEPPLLKAIAKDPVLSKVKLIAEPWDAAGLYHVGRFCPHGPWSEWNGKYRDRVRSFLRGTGNKGEFASSLCGSEDLYTVPLKSINFVTAHDGFTLRDLTTYNRKRNLLNGEENRDGTNDNESWNCGVEGPTTNKAILAIRERQMRNFHMALLTSLGIPMLHMGDEYSHTKEGNNNTWCQDNRLSWFLWDQIEKNQEFFRFYCKMIQFRKENPLFNRDQFLTDEDIIWQNKYGKALNWNDDNKIIAYTLKDPLKGEDFFIAYNVHNNAEEIFFPENRNEKKWHWVVNTASPSPYDFRDPENHIPIISTHYKMLAHSALILKLIDFSH